MLKIREIKDKFVEYWNRLGESDKEEEVEINYPAETLSRLNALELLVSNDKKRDKPKKGDSRTIKRDNPIRDDGGKQKEELDYDEREL